MKVAIKTVRAGFYQIDAEPTDSIRIIKSKIEESHGFIVHSQKIIFSGDVLKDDDRTLESYGFSFSEDNFLMLMVQKNRTSVTPIPSTPNSAFPRAVPIPNPVTAPTDTAVTSIASAGNSNYPAAPGFIKPSPNFVLPQVVRPNISSSSSVTSSANTSITPPVATESLNYPSTLASGSIQPSQSSSAELHRPQAARIEEGNKKPLATLVGSEIDDFEELKAMGFSQQATAEAYLLCDRNKEFAANYLLEHGGDPHPSDAGPINNGSQSTQLTKMSRVDSKNIAQLLSTLGKPQFDEIERLEALGFPHTVALAAYLACNKNADIAASFLVELGDALNFDTDTDSTLVGSSMISKTPMALPSTARITDDTQITSAVTLPENSTPSVPSPTPSTKSLGKRPERPLSPDSILSCLDDDASKDNTSAASSAICSSQPSSPSLSLLTEVSSVSSVNTPSEVTTIDDSEIEENFGSEAKAIIKRLEVMKLPREAVIEAICVCDGDEERSVQYLRDNGYDV